MTWGPTSLPAKNHSSKVWQFSTSLGFFATLTEQREESVTFHLRLFFFFLWPFSRSLQSSQVLFRKGGFCNLTMHEPWKRPVCMNLHNGEVLCWAGDPKSMVSSRGEESLLRKKPAAAASATDFILEILHSEHSYPPGGFQWAGAEINSIIFIPLYLSSFQRQAASDVIMLSKTQRVHMKLVGLSKLLSRRSVHTLSIKWP